MERGALVDKMFYSIQLAFRRVPASLAVATLIVCTFWGIASGLVGAVVVLMGVIAFNPMLRAGYDVKLASGVITAGGTLGILIPPSVMLVVMAPVLDISIIDLYVAAFGPGFLLAGLYIAYCMVRSFINPALGPPVPKEERLGDAWLVIKEVLIGILPLTALIGFTLGTILAGMATPTEAASCGAFGATLLALLYRRLTFEALKNAAVSTMVTSSMVLFLVVASNVFGAVFTKLGTASIITDALVGLPLPDMWKLALIMLLIFVLGWPFEWPAIILVFLPIFLPVVEKLNFGMSKLDMLIWFGTLVAVNLQTAFLSPPVAMSAYYLKNVVPQWSLSTIYRGMADYMVIQIVCLLALIMWPQIALWLPNALK